MGLATFLLGDVTNFSRYAARTPTRASGSGATSTTRRTRGAPTPKLTLNYGLRLDVINPQTVNEAGNGGWLDLNTGEILIGGVGDVNLAGNVKNNLNWAPRVGVTYQLNEKTVIRGGYGRTYDIGVFGSLFGHSVTQNLPVLSVQQLNAPSNFDRVFTLDQGPDRADVPDLGHGPLPAEERRVHARAAAQAAAARGGRVQRHGAAPADRRDVGRGRLRRQLRRARSSWATVRP